MKLTPLDIRRNEFSRAMRGYNREEVENFLTVVADEVEGLVGEHRELARRVNELQKEIDDYRSLERTLMETLVTAQRTSDEMRESSQREAEVTKREAQVRAEQLVENARIEAERLLMEARHKAHEALEEARQKAHDALEAARRQAEEMYQTARQEALAAQRQTQSLIERREALLAGMRAYLTGQLDALEALSDEEVPQIAPLPDHDAPVVTDEEAEALAALDRELAEFAAATAPERPAERKQETASKSEAQTQQPGDNAASSQPEDGSEVLIDGQSQGS